MTGAGHERTASPLARIDFIGIYLLIAGTYTPLAGSLLRGRWRWILLGSVWLVTVAASALISAGVNFPKILSTGLYLGMGWGFIVCYLELTRAVSHRALMPLIVGGLFTARGR